MVVGIEETGHFENYALEPQSLLPPFQLQNDGLSLCPLQKSFGSLALYRALTNAAVSGFMAGYGAEYERWDAG